MHPLLTKRVEVPEIWFDALMFAFKLPTVILPAGLLIWYAFLPAAPVQSNGSHYSELICSFKAGDFASVTFQLSDVLFLSALTLIIGGLVQLYRSSGRSSGWSLGFGLFALIVGIALANVSLPFPLLYGTQAIDLYGPEVIG